MWERFVKEAGYVGYVTVDNGRLWNSTPHLRQWRSSAVNEVDRSVLSTDNGDRWELSKYKNSSGDEIVNERELLRNGPGSYPNSLK